MNHRVLRPATFLRLTGFAALAAGGLLLGGCGKDDKKAAAPKGFETADQKVSYGLGYNMGANLAKQNALTVDQAAVAAGLQDGLSGAKLRLPEADIQAAFTALDQKAAKLAEESGKANLAAGQAFLDKNKARPGVKTTLSGLQYEVLKTGKGAKPKPTDRVQVHYHGTLIDGTVFDSSVQRNEPAEFQVQGVIPGWVEALQLMPVGSKWKLFVPSTLAYGPRAAGKIPPSSVLVFEVELLAIK